MSTIIVMVTRGFAVVQRSQIPCIIVAEGRDLQVGSTPQEQRQPSAHAPTVAHGAISCGPWTDGEIVHNLARAPSVGI